MRAKLTKTLVDAVSATTKDTVVWDTEVPGFALKVTPAGQKSYFVFYRTSSGQQRKPTVARHGTMTVDEARKVAKRWLADRTLGGDISLERQQGRASPDVRDLAERYMVEYAVPHKKPSSTKSDRANIENHVLPLIGGRKVGEVTRADIEAMKVAIAQGKTARHLPAKPRGRRIVKGGQGTANRVLALVSKMFSCAEEWGLREGNPAKGIRKYREFRKDRFLDADEIARLLSALTMADLQGIELPVVTSAIRLLLFTGLRAGEVLGLRWRDVDLPNQCVRLTDSKTGARVVALSSHAMEAVATLEPKVSSALVFPGAKADRPVALTRPWYRVRELAGIDDGVNLHSLRHTFASWSVMGGLSLSQVGALLGHKSAQTTLRYADHALESMRSYSEQTGAAFTAMTARIKPVTA